MGGVKKGKPPDSERVDEEGEAARRVAVKAAMFGLLSHKHPPIGLEAYIVDRADLWKVGSVEETRIWETPHHGGPMVEAEIVVHAGERKHRVRIKVEAEWLGECEWEQVSKHKPRKGAG